MLLLAILAVVVVVLVVDAGVGGGAQRKARLPVLVLEAVAQNNERTPRRSRVWVHKDEYLVKIGSVFIDWWRVNLSLVVGCVVGWWIGFERNHFCDVSFSESRADLSK